MDLSSNHPQVMLVATPFAVQLHITPLPQKLPIGIGPNVSLGRLALKPLPRSTDSFLFANNNKFDEEEFVIQELQPSSLELEKKQRRMPNLSMTPRAKSVAFMALAMALHFGGYEFARSATLSLFTSSSTGFSTPAAFPLAMSMVTPLSFVLLMGYTSDLEQNGPRVALRHSTIFSIVMLAATGTILKLLEYSPIVLGSNIPLSQLVVGLAFLFQQSYAHLLYAQQWSFIGSIMTPQEGSKWFSSIAGLSSVAAACSGTIVSQLVPKIGLTGLLLCTCVTLFLSLLSAERAYAMSQEFGFDPADEIAQKQKDKNAKQQENRQNMVARGKDLFQRVPTLKALFCEVLSFQSLSTILNVCFVTKLRSTIVDDVARASYTGKLYSLINTISAAFQFVIMPLAMKRIEPKLVWRLMPLIPFACSLYQSMQPDASLLLLAFSFFAAKCMDYSFRGVVNEMVYVPLDFESRYVGKEIIGVFGNRFGKSGMSLLLSILTYTFGNFGIHQLSLLSLFASSAWMSCAWWLSGLVPSQAQAEEMVEERQQRNKKDS